MFLYGFKWNGLQEISVYGFSQNIDFVLFLLFQTLGWIAVNILITFLSQLISNKYSYAVSLPILTFILIVFAVLFFTLTGNIRLIMYLSYVLFHYVIQPIILNQFTGGI